MEIQIGSVGWRHGRDQQNVLETNHIVLQLIRMNLSTEHEKQNAKSNNEETKISRHTTSTTCRNKCLMA